MRRRRPPGRATQRGSSRGKSGARARPTTLWLPRGVAADRRPESAARPAGSRPSIWTRARKRTSQPMPSTPIGRARLARRPGGRRGAPTGRRAPREHRAVPWPRRRIRPAGDESQRGGPQTLLKQPGPRSLVHVDPAGPIPGSGGPGDKRPPHSRRAGGGCSDDSRRASGPRRGSPARRSSRSRERSDLCGTWSTSSGGGSNRGRGTEGSRRDCHRRPSSQTGCRAWAGTERR